LKNQNDLIFSIVSVVLAAIIIAVFAFTKPEPKTAPSAEVVNTGELALPGADVKWANALPGGNQQSGGGAAGAPGGGGGPNLGGADVAQ
jgi:hypothetical protein